MTAGQYTDTLTSGAGRRHYTVRRTIPGSTLRVAVTMRPPYSESANQELVRMRLAAVDQPCEDGLASRIGSSAFAGLVTGTLRLSGTKSPRQAKATGCETSDTVTLSLDREDGGPTPNPAEILVMEEPPANAVDSLPAADKDRPEQAAPAPSAPQPVVGGPTFSSAPRISPGSWQETFMSGETIFYRVPVEWGQRLRVSVVPAPGSVTDEIRALTHYAPVLYGPDRGILGETSLSYGSFGQNLAPQPTQQVSTEVRYRNREKPESNTADLAGDYFIRIAIPLSRQGVAVEVPMTFRVEVEGTVKGAPAYAGTPPDASTSPSASPTTSDETSTAAAADATPAEDDGSSGFVWLGLGLVAVLGALGAAYAILHTRRGRRTDNDGELQ